VKPGIDIDAAVGSAASEYDALADLFLADETPARANKRHVGPRLVRPDDEPEPARAPQPKSSRATPHIEGVLVGHLPVLASAWLTQYARFQADSAHEPVALLRIHGDQALLDVVMPGGVKPPPSAAAKPGESMRAVIQRAAATWRRWIVRVDQGQEPELLGLESLSSVALLTGADDAAVVSSYQLMKGLGSVAASDSTAPSLRLVIMGAADVRAGDAEQSLRRAAGTFLGRTIDSAVRVGKIGSSMAVQVYHGSSDLSIAEVLDIIASSRHKAPQTAARPTPNIPKIEVPRIAPGTIAPRPIPLNGSARAPIPLVPAPPTATPRALADQIPGLKSLSLDCPYAPGVELAAAPDARLHLVAGANGTLSVSEAAQRLLTAAAWANDHAKLLHAACPTLKQVDPVLHVVTTHAKEARGLLDTGMRVHLLSRVEVNGAVGWAVSDLN
jgi:hypothetical protein